MTRADLLRIRDGYWTHRLAVRQPEEFRRGGVVRLVLVNRELPPLTPGLLVWNDPPVDHIVAGYRLHFWGRGKYAVLGWLEHEQPDPTRRLIDGPWRDGTGPYENPR